MAKAKKISRKELLKREDAFLAAAHHSTDWATENKGKIGLGLGLVVAMSLAVWAATSMLQARNAEASALYDAALKRLEGTVDASGASAGRANNGDDDYTYPTEQDKWSDARAAFAKVSKKGGGSGVAHMARFYEADLAAKMGEAQAAEEAFLKLAGDLTARDSLFFLAVERAAYLQEAREDYDGALATLGKIKLNAFYADQALLHKARLLVRKGQPQEARQALELLQERFAKSPLVSKAKDMLGALPPAPAEASETAGAEAEAKGAGTAQAKGPGAAETAGGR